MDQEVPAPQPNEGEEKPEMSPEELASQLQKEKEARIKAEDLAKNQKIRAEKAEQALKEKAPDAPSQDGLSNKDILYLAKADIHQDDLDDVLKQARVQGIPVAEAHKFMKPILDVRAEERRTAAATQTRGGQRSGQSDNAEALLQKATRGEVPESDAEIEKLAEARMAQRLKK